VQGIKRIPKKQQATSRILVTDAQQKDMFALALTEQRPITHIFQEMLDIYTEKRFTSARKEK
jgi:hypothetical protein